MNTKWIKLTCSIDIGDVVGLLLKNPIKPRESFGFDVFEMEQSFFHGAFYERISESINYTLPDGTQIKSEVQKVTLFDFSMYKVDDAIYYICIVDPPRSLKSFVDRFSQTLSNPVYFSGLSLDIRHVISALKEMKSVSLLKVKELSVSNLLLDKSNTADLTVKSLSNALDALELSFPEQNFTVKNVKLTFFYEGGAQQFKGSKTGSLDCSADFGKELLSIVKSCVV